MITINNRDFARFVWHVLMAKGENEEFKIVLKFVNSNREDIEKEYSIDNLFDEIGNVIDNFKSK
jgi:hypothetical protein